MHTGHFTHLSRAAENMSERLIHGDLTRLRVARSQRRDGGVLEEFREVGVSVHQLQAVVVDLAAQQLHLRQKSLPFGVRSLRGNEGKEKGLMIWLKYAATSSPQVKGFDDLA